jgi:peptide/nickel transport system permease protein
MQIPRFRLTRRLRLPRAELLIGGALVGLIALCAVAAPLLAPFDPLEQQLIFAGGTLVPPPYPPGTEGMLLGSDPLGRDLLSRLIYGARYTLAFCGISALLRVLFAAALGMLGGWYGRAGRTLDVLTGAWSAVPSLFFAIIPLALVSRIGSNQLNALAFVLIFACTGWAEAAVRVRVAVEGLRGTPFIESAYAIGLRRWQVLWRHVRPNLRALLLVEAAYAMAAVLLLTAELGFLNIFIGGAEREVLGGTVNVDPLYAEWGGLLAKGLRERRAGPWLFLAPTAVLTASILAFNLLAEGLRKGRRSG